MIYNNLLYFLTAIFLFSMATTPAKPAFSIYLTISSYLVLLVLFDILVSLLYRRAEKNQAAGYFKAEKQSSIIALLIYSLMIFGLDLKYYLLFLSLNNTMPALVNIGGVGVFLFLLILIWRRARPSYENVFARKYRTMTFIFSNIKANLPIVIPWMILTLCYDLIRYIPWPWLQKINESSWGDILFFGTFLLFIFIFFPPLVRRLWGCKMLEQGPLRDHLQAFCKKQEFSAELYLWPLFEGRVITAGVMGVIPGLRYILITPALLETMTIDELDSVMAHEIGHVKRFHLILYVFLIGGFILTTGFLAEPLYYLFFSKDIFYSLVSSTGLSPEILRNVLVAVPALFFLLLYFRFVFGYFMRNFERQADLHVFPVLGNSDAIISAFEKIAILSGNIRNQPSWHHFGIGQRVDFLKKCEKNPEEIKKHHRKVSLSLIAFIVFIVVALFSTRNFSYDEAIDLYEEKYTRADLLYEATQEKDPAHWLFFAGNYLLEHKLEKRAAIAFELALEKESNQPDLLNNYSWLLLTSMDTKLRNPKKALTLARSAALLKPNGYILDTLATAWWANGYVEEAIKVQQEAMYLDPDKKDYYQSQILRFQQSTYLEELQSIIGKDVQIRALNISEEQG